MKMSYTEKSLSITALGQSGLRLSFGQTVIFIDPYLSNSVQEYEASDMERLIPVRMHPESIYEADWVFITHAHRDHLDLDTLLPIANVSGCHLVGPQPVVEILRNAGIAESRLHELKIGDSIELNSGWCATTVPAAHPTIDVDSEGRCSCVGYIFNDDARTLYHAGDTSPHQEIIDAARAVGIPDIAFLPVNERNHYRDKRGIVGNMSVREAFAFAEELGTKTLVPLHWDMFRENGVFWEEIETVYDNANFSFNLVRDVEKEFDRCW